MKLVRFGARGCEKPGIIDRQGNIRDISKFIRDLEGDWLGEEGLFAINSIDLMHLPVVGNTTRLGPCVGKVGKLLAIGLNYTDHAKETNSEIPGEPIVFTKWTSAISGPNDDVVIPRGCSKVDWEVELGIVIGKRGKYVTEEDALSYVAGYCVSNDISERAYQLERYGLWDKGKSFDTFAPLGPWLVTKDEIADVQNLNLWLEVDGIRRQSSTTSNMIFSVAKLVSYVSTLATIYPGDIITSGTPAGVGLGMNPPVYLKAGQKMKLGIDGLGVQYQIIRQEE